MSGADAESAVAAVPAMASRLGYAGLVPFVAGALLCLLPDPAWGAFGERLLIGYAAVILSFMGAVHWGVALGEPALAPRLYLVSVLPALLAWVALLIPPLPALALLATTFTLLFAFDLRQSRDGPLPAWYPRLRAPLTFVVLMCLGLGALGVG
jgi:hypothetical protein